MLECAKYTDTVYKAVKGNDGISTMDCVNASYVGHRKFLCGSDELGNFYFWQMIGKADFYM